MNQILDKIDIKHHQTKFSKLSFAMSLITLGLTSYLFFGIPSTINVAEGIQAPTIAFVFATLFSCLFGIIMMVLSIAKKEASTWYKWTGGIINTLLFLLILGSVVFARLV